MYSLRLLLSGCACSSILIGEVKNVCQAQIVYECGDGKKWKELAHRLSKELELLEEGVTTFNSPFFCF